MSLNQGVQGSSPCRRTKESGNDRPLFLYQHLTDRKYSAENALYAGYGQFSERTKRILQKAVLGTKRLFEFSVLSI